VNKYLHVSFNFKGKPKVKELETTFDKAADWVRYAENCWIIYTHETVNIWADRLNKLIGKDDTVLIIEMGTLYRGWMEQSVVDWLSKRRN
jgi:hypothetical protein